MQLLATHQLCSSRWPDVDLLVKNGAGYFAGCSVSYAVASWVSGLKEFLWWF